MSYINGIIPQASASELLIVLVIVLVVFGGAKLPKLARSLGRAQKEFKTGLNEAAEEESEPEANEPESTEKTSKK